jgi:hypothetical protein
MFNWLDPSGNSAGQLSSWLNKFRRNNNLPFITFGWQLPATTLKETGGFLFFLLHGFLQI